MTENEALALMKAPGQLRPSKPYRGGVIQILVTSSCDKACYGCTQGSQLRRKPWFMTPEQYAQAIESLKGYWGVVGMFGGNPALHPQFKELCAVLRESWVPFEQRGIWSNNPLRIENAMEMRRTFNPRYSNLNVHLDGVAHKLFREGWPEAQIVGLHEDSRHSPPWVAMKDVVTKTCHYCDGRGCDSDQEDCLNCEGTGNVADESRIWELVSGCDINQRWSAGIGVFRGELRAFFCEVAMAQAILHQDEPDYPDTGLDPTKVFRKSGVDCGDEPGAPLVWKEERHKWWELPMYSFTAQVRKHCFECGVPLRGYGELSQQSDDKGKEQTSATHANIFHPKRKDRHVQQVTDVVQLGLGRIQRSTDYLQNARK